MTQSLFGKQPLHHGIIVRDCGNPRIIRYILRVVNPFTTRNVSPLSEPITIGGRKIPLTSLWNLGIQIMWSMVRLSIASLCHVAQLRGHPGKYFLPTSESSRSKRSLTLCNYGLPGRPGLLGVFFSFFFISGRSPRLGSTSHCRCTGEGRPDDQRSLRRE